ncbi:MAG: cupin domain-containing protein [Proteobacteria bacterium]|nr:cupin domain-containing protein [Pseudomonadota bacterium]
MSQLGSLEELPQEYRQALAAANLVPLWPSLRALLPPGSPATATAVTHLPWQVIRPLLLRAGELTPMEKAERRVLVLSNPGRGLDNLQASSVIYLGMQLVLPGEVAPNHRHTPNAARIVVEGQGACTIVDGDKCPMEPGDLILTPTGLWHEHRHEGTGPMIWLDVLDLPLMVYLDRSYAIEGQPQRPRPLPAAYGAGGLVPLRHGGRSRADYPLLRYEWRAARRALEALAESTPANQTIELAYVNPETGDAPLNTLAFSALMLRPGQEAALPRMSAARVFHVVQGAGKATIAAQTLSYGTADTFCAPGGAAVRLANASAGEPLFLISADESPVQRKLGVFETWDA